MDHHAVRTRWGDVVIVLGAGVVSAFQVGKASAALGAVQGELSLSLAVASWLISAFAVIGAVAGVAIGLGADRIGAKRMAVGGLLLQGVASGLGALADGAPWLLATRFIEGLGFLAVTVGAPALVVQLTAPRERDRAMSLWATFMPLGLTGILAAAPLLQAIGWRGFWLVNAVVLIGWAIPLMVRMPRRPDAGALRSVGEDIRGILTARAPWLLAGLFAAFAALFFAVFGFLPLVLSDRLGVGAELGSVLTGLAILASAAGNLVCGFVLARGLSPARILTVAFALLALTGTGIFLDAAPGLASYGLSIAFAFTSGFIPVVIIDAAPRLAPRRELIGATLGFAMQGNNLGLVAGPALTGLIAGSLGWGYVPVLLIGLALAAGTLVAMLAARAAPAAVR